MGAAPRRAAWTRASHPILGPVLDRVIERTPIQHPVADRQPRHPLLLGQPRIDRPPHHARAQTAVQRGRESDARDHRHRDPRRLWVARDQQVGDAPRRAFELRVRDGSAERVDGDPGRVQARGPLDPALALVGHVVHPTKRVAGRATPRGSAPPG